MLDQVKAWFFVGQTKKKPPDKLAVIIAPTNGAWLRFFFWASKWGAAFAPKSFKTHTP